MFEKILNNVLKDSGEYSRLFRGMFKKIPVNVRKDSRECYQRFRGMFKRNLDLGNLNLDYYFMKSCLFLSDFTIKLLKINAKKAITEQFFSKKHFQRY